MGQRVVYFSDLTDKPIEDGKSVACLVIVNHPALEGGPVKLEVSEGEIEYIRSSALSTVSLKLSLNDGSGPGTVTMELGAFNRLVGEKDMAEVIRGAAPAYPPRQQIKPAQTVAPEGSSIWPWLVAIVLTLVVVGLLIWTAKWSGLWTI